MAFDPNSPDRETCRVTIDQARERSALIARLAKKVAERAESDGMTVNIHETNPEPSRRKRAKKQQPMDSRGIE